MLTATWELSAVGTVRALISHELDSYPVLRNPISCSSDRAWAWGEFPACARS